MTTLRIKHIRQAGYCASGTRVWFERHNINYVEFLKNGIDVEILEATGDHFALVASQLARDEEAAGQSKPDQQQQEVSNG
jgi:hypothetical protein